MGKQQSLYESKEYEDYEDYEEYEDGNSVRKVFGRSEYEEEYEERQKEQINPVSQKKAAQAVRIGRGIDLFYLAVITIAVIATLFICIDYLHVQSDIVQLNKQITSLRNEVTTVTKENDAFENSLETVQVDLDYVYKVAVGYLGMVYPDQNEVVYYESSQTGYVRQYQDIPD